MPTFITVSIARPLACRRIASGIDFSGLREPTCAIIIIHKIMQCVIISVHASEMGVQ